MSDSNRQRRLGTPGLEGKEIFEIKPVILGGSPTDLANKTLLSREDHIKAVTYWNRLIAGLRAKRTDNR
jgi:hypothetical protein